jgi:GNAT superfamily N-acetyltransferase
MRVRGTVHTERPSRQRRTEIVLLTEVAGDREPFVPLLLEADEAEEVLRSYLHDGRLFDLRHDGRSVGVALLLRDAEQTEIKNIALREGERGKGLGRAAIDAIAQLAAGEGARSLIVGTADSSPGTIAFYRACGFEPAGVRRGFFDAYPEPVIEDGVRARDMVMLRMSLPGRLHDGGAVTR